MASIAKGGGPCPEEIIREEKVEILNGAKDNVRPGQAFERELEA